MKRNHLASSPTRFACSFANKLTCLIGIALFFTLASSSRAADTIYYWDATGTATSTPTTDGAGTWSTSNSNWYNSGADAVWSNTANSNGATSEAYIGVSNSGGPYTITVGSGGVNVNEIYFGATGTLPVYTIAGDGNAADTINLVGTTPTIFINNGAATATISDVITGSSGLTKTGAGGLTLAANETYTGNTTISVAQLAISVANALPTATYLSLANAGTTFSLKAVNQTVGSLSSVSGSTIRNTTFGTGILTIGSGGSVGTSNTLAGTLRDSNLGNSFGLTINDSSTTETITGTTNGYTGATTINLGTLIISSDANIGGNAGTVALTATSGSKNVSGITEGTAAIGVGTVMLGTTVATAGNSGSTSVLTLTANAGSTYTSSTPVNYATAANLDLNGGVLEANGTFSLSESSSSGAGGTATANRSVIIGTSATGTIDVTGSNTLTVPGVVSGSSGSLTKTDTGTLLLSGANSYGGATTVSGGTLNLTGSLNTSTAVSVAAGAQFALGTAGETTSTVNQTVSSLTLNSTGTTTSTEAKLSLNLGPTTNDSITTGALTLNLTGTATAFNLVLNDGGTLPTGSETLLTWTAGGITTSQIDLTGSSSGINLSNLSVSGDSLIFSVTSVPEPGTYALLLSGMVLLAFYPRRRTA